MAHDHLDDTEPSTDSPWTVRSDEVVGSEIGGRYRVVRHLGEGGMGQVYAAEDQILGATVALKALRPELARSSIALERFRREMQLARQVTSAHVCRLYNVGEHDGRVFLTMELLEGHTLAGMGPVTIERLASIAEQLVVGLLALHAAGVIHRDLKPSNVMLVEDRVVITDFGLARPIDDRAGITQESELLGTPAYMAPEQASGRIVTTATDVYALGVMLFELATGRLPFTGDTTLAIATARLTQDPPRASSFRPELPASWDAIIARCLVRDPAKRPKLGELLRPRRSRAWLAGVPAIVAIGVTQLPQHHVPERVALAIDYTDPVGVAMAVDLQDALATAGVPLVPFERYDLFEVFADKPPAATIRIADWSQRFTGSPTEIVDQIARAIATEYGLPAPRRSRDRCGDYARYGAALIDLMRPHDIQSRDEWNRIRAPLEQFVASEPQCTRAAARLVGRLVDNAQQREDNTAMPLIAYAHAVADRALAIDPDAPMLLAARGMVALLEYDPASSRWLHRAVALAPTHPITTARLDFSLRMHGELVEADALPHGEAEPFAIAWALFYGRKFDELLHYLETVPRSPALDAWRAMALAELARFDEAIALADSIDSRDNLDLQASLVRVYALAGQRDKALALRANIGDRAGAMAGAQMDDVLGNHAAALAALERIVAMHNISALLLKIELFTPALRAEPRFQALVKTVGFE